MRMTLTLEPEIAEKLRAVAASDGSSVKKTVHQALKQRLGMKETKSEKPFEITTFSSGFQPGVDPSELWQFLEDEDAAEYLRKRSGT